MTCPLAVGTSLLAYSVANYLLLSANLCQLAIETHNADYEPKTIFWGNYLDIFTLGKMRFLDGCQGGTPLCYGKG